MCDPCHPKCKTCDKNPTKCTSCHPKKNRPLSLDPAVNIWKGKYPLFYRDDCSILASTRSESSLECFKPKEPTIEHFKAFEIQKQANYWGELLHAREVFDPGSKLLILSQYIFSVV